MSISFSIDQLADWELVRLVEEGNESAKQELESRKLYRKQFNGTDPGEKYVSHYVE